MPRGYLTVADVLGMHTVLMQRYGGALGVRDPGMLEAALFRPQTGYYEDILAEAAALMESLAINHPFVDGNKRIAFAAEASEFSSDPWGTHDLRTLLVLPANGRLGGASVQTANPANLGLHPDGGGAPRSRPPVWELRQEGPLSPGAVSPSARERRPSLAAEAQQSTPCPPVKREVRLHLSAALAAVPAAPQRAEWMTVPGQDASSSGRNSAGRSRAPCRMRTTVTASADASKKMT